MTLGQFFHYAPWEYVPRIVSSGMLKPSNAGGAPEEPGLVWFSANQSWEPTATKIVPLHSGGVRRLSFREQMVKFGCVRFGIDPADPTLLDWKAACEFAHISRDERRRLEAKGKKLGGKPEHWYATPVEIPLDRLSFDVYLNNSWHPAVPSEMAAVWLNRAK